MTCTQLDHGKTTTCRNCGKDFGGGINALYDGMVHTGQLTRAPKPARDIRRPADLQEPEHQE